MLRQLVAALRHQRLRRLDLSAAEQRLHVQPELSQHGAAIDRRRRRPQRLKLRGEVRREGEVAQHERRQLTSRKIGDGLVQGRQLRAESVPDAERLEEEELMHPLVRHDLYQPTVIGARGDDAGVGGRATDRLGERRPLPVPLLRRLQLDRLLQREAEAKRPPLAALDPVARRDGEHPERLFELEIDRREDPAEAGEEREGRCEAGVLQHRSHATLDDRLHVVLQRVPFAP